MDFTTDDVFEMFSISKTRLYDNLELLYYRNCSAGGEHHQNAILGTVRERGKQKYQSMHEWCAGHGAIGFSVLATGLAEKISLSDKFLPAIVSCRFTALHNNYENQTKIYKIDRFDAIPEDEKWDLVIADPPFFRDESNNQGSWNQDGKRQVLDENYNSHRNFFSNLKKHLLPDADVFLLEGRDASTADDFKDMIESGGLTYIDTYYMKEWPKYYLMHIKNT